jgi:glycosyltransferase involved in cell wall biosynthesis
MIIGIDATNIRVGGGIHHLVEVLGIAEPDKHDFSQIILFGGSKTLEQIESRPWLTKVMPPELNRGLIHRTFWQRFFLSAEARRYKCDLLFVPGGSYVGDFKPVISMSQNLLPFQWCELRRYGLSFSALKLLLLRLSQARTFASVDGVIFLTEYARSVVNKVVNLSESKTTVIPHGINSKFSFDPKPQLSINSYSSEMPYRMLYISTVDLFKHQWHVIEATAKLRNLGYPVTLDLVGSSHPIALKRMKIALAKNDPKNTFIRYTGPLPYGEIERKYAEADLFIFASSCETFGQIITEAMSAGLPIACSRQSAMSELLENGGVYFDPECADSIASSVRSLLDDPELRSLIATKAFTRASQYTWTTCADQTFNFFQATLRRSQL